MPATFALGAAYTMGKLTVEADADWTFWHSFTDLPITIQNPVPTLFSTTNPKRTGKTSSLSASGWSTG